MAIRKLVLKNGNNAFDLTDKGQFLENPKGLGIAKKLKMLTVPTGFKYVAKEEVDLPKITGTIIFEDYNNFNKLEEFLVVNKVGLQLEYTIPINNVDTTYKAYVVLEKLERSEITAGNKLRSNIVLIRTTNWFKNIGLPLETTMELISSTKYPRKYPYTYGYKNPHYTKASYTYGGNYKVWVNVEMSANVAKPHIIFRDLATQKVVGEIKADNNILEGIKNIVSIHVISTPWNRNAYILTGQGEKISIITKLSIDDGVQNFISLLPGTYIIEVDDLEPDIIGQRVEDRFTFTFIEETGV